MQQQQQQVQNDGKQNLEYKQYCDISLSFGTHTFPLTLWTQPENTPTQSLNSNPDPYSEQQHYELVSILDSDSLFFWALQGGKWKVSTESVEASNFLTNVFGLSLNNALLVQQVSQSGRANPTTTQAIQTSQLNSNKLKPTLLIYSATEHNQSHVYATSYTIQSSFLETLSHIMETKSNSVNNNDIDDDDDDNNSNDTLPTTYDYFQIAPFTTPDTHKSTFLFPTATKTNSTLGSNTSANLGLSSSSLPHNPFTRKVAAATVSKNPFLSTPLNPVAQPSSSSSALTSSSTSTQTSIPSSSSASSIPSAASTKQPHNTETESKPDPEPSIDLARQKQALQHLVLAALRLRGITKETSTFFPQQSSASTNAEEYKELYHQTFRAAQFAVLQKNRAKAMKSGSNSNHNVNGNSDGNTNGSGSNDGNGAGLSLVELQEIVDKLLNLFLPDH